LQAGDAHGTQQPPMLETFRRHALTRGALLRLLGRVDAAPSADATTTYVTPGAALPAALPADAEAAVRQLGDDRTGFAIFWGEAARIVVAPPFPIEAHAEHQGFVTEPLRALLTRPRALGIILVRRGGYSIGIYQHGTFVQTKTGARFVKNRHRKGGQSQRRFERIRAGQIREQFDEVADVIRTRILPAASALDAVVLGGDRHTVQAMLKRAPLPPALAVKLLPRVIDVPEPRRDVLERSPVAIWTSRVLIVRGLP
jgi:hypothetical protein